MLPIGDMDDWNRLDNVGRNAGGSTRMDV
jgi:hypothetical protein